MSIDSGSNADKALGAFGSSGLKIDQKVQTEAGGRVYLLVTRGDQKFRLSAEGLFGNRLQEMAGRNLNQQQMLKISAMVDHVFFSTGTPIKGPRTLNIQFSENIGEHVKRLCEQRAESFGDNSAEFVKHTSFGKEHTSDYVQHIAESYYTLCRSWDELGGKIENVENQLEGLRGEKESRAQEGVGEANLRVDFKQEQIDEAKGAIENLKLDLIDAGQSLQGAPDDATLRDLVQKLSAEVGQKSEQLRQLQSEKEGALSDRDALQAKLQSQEANFQEQLSFLGAANSQLTRQVGDTSNQARASTAELDQLRAALSELRGQLDESQKYGDTLSQKNRQLEQARGASDSSLHKLQSEIDELGAKLKESQEGEKSSSAENLALRATQNSHLQAIGDLERKIGEKEGELSELRSDRSNLEAQSDQTRGELVKIQDKLREEIKELKSASGQQKETIKRLEHTGAKLDLEISAKQSQIDQLLNDKNSLKKDKDALTSERNALRDESALHRGRAEEYQSQIKVLTSSKESLTGLQESLSSETKTLRESLIKAESALRDKTNLLESQGDTIKDLLEQGARAKDETRDLKAHSQQLQDQIKELTGSQQKLTGMREDLQGQLDKALDDLRVKEKTLENHEGKLGQLGKSVDELKGREKDLKNQISELNSAKSEISGNQQKLSAEREKLQGALDKSQGELRQKEIDLQKEKLQVQNLEGELQRSKGQGAELENKSAQFNKLNDELRDKIRQLTDTNTQLSGQQSQLSKENKNLQENLSQSESTIAQQKGQIGQLDSKINTAKSEISALTGEKRELGRDVEELKQREFLLQNTIDALTKKNQALNSIVKDDPSVPELNKLIEKMEADRLLYVNRLTTNDILYNSAGVNLDELRSFIADVAGKSELSPELINNFTTAALCLEARGSSEWKTALEKHPELESKVPPQLQALAAGIQSSVTANTAKSEQIIGDCKRILQQTQVSPEAMAKTKLAIDNSMREIVRNLVSNKGVDAQALDLNQLRGQLLRPDSILSKVVGTFDPKVKEQLCFLSYYQNIFEHIDQRRVGQSLSTHEQWQFLYDTKGSTSTLFQPKPENLLHLVNALNETRLKGATLTSNQMPQLGDIFGMMNSDKPSANMFSPTGSGKTAIVELTMALTRKLTDHPPQFYYISSIPSTVEGVHSYLFGDPGLKITQENGVYKMAVQDTSSKDQRKIVFIDEAHRISSACEVSINGSEAQNVRITATPSTRSSLLADRGSEMSHQVQVLSDSYSAGFGQQLTKQEQTLQLGQMRELLDTRLKGLNTKSADQLQADIANTAREVQNRGERLADSLKGLATDEGVRKLGLAGMHLGQFKMYIGQVRDIYLGKRTHLDPNVAKYGTLYSGMQQTRDALSGIDREIGAIDALKSANFARQNQLDNFQKDQQQVPQLKELLKSIEQFSIGNQADSFSVIAQKAARFNIAPKGVDTELLPAARIRSVAQAAFKQQAEALGGAVANEIAQSQFLKGVEERRSFTNLSRIIGGNYSQVECKSLDQIGGMLDQMRGKLGQKNQIILPNFVLADNQVGGVIDKLKSKLQLGDETAFLYTDKKGEKIVRLGKQEAPLGKFSQDKLASASRFVMLYDERTSAGGDYEDISKNNAQDGAFKQFVLFNSQGVDSLGRSLKTDTLVQALGRMREGSRGASRDNVETHLFGDQPNFNSSLPERSLFGRLQAAQEDSYRESDIHEVANRLTGAVTRAYTLTTGGLPAGETLGVYSKVANALSGAGDAELAALQRLQGEILSDKPLQSVGAVMNLLGSLGIEKEVQKRMQAGLESLLRGELPASEGASLTRSGELLSGVTGLLQEAVYTNLALTRLSKSGAFAARAA